MAQGFRSGVSELHTYSIGHGLLLGHGRKISIEILYQECDGMYVVWYLV